MPPDSPSHRSRLDPLESITHAFIVKVWLEDGSSGKEGAPWRGHIVHVPSNERLYIRSLDQITVFIQPYLERMGVRVGLFARVTAWLKRRMRTQTM